MRSRLPVVSKPDAGAPGDLYDRFGFSVSANLGAALQSLKASDQETAHNARWDAWFDARDRELLKGVALPDILDTKANQELKHLIRGGIPDKYRSEVWGMLVSGHTSRAMKFQGEHYYERILEYVLVGQPQSPLSLSRMRLALLGPRTRLPTHRADRKPSQAQEGQALRGDQADRAGPHAHLSVASRLPGE